MHNRLHLVENKILIEINFQNIILIEKMRFNK